MKNKKLQPIVNKLNNLIKRGILSVADAYIVLDIYDGYTDTFIQQTIKNLFDEYGIEARPAGIGWKVIL